MEGVFTAEAVIDNGAFGTHTIKFGPAWPAWPPDPPSPRWTT